MKSFLFCCLALLTLSVGAQGPGSIVSGVEKVYVSIDPSELVASGPGVTPLVSSVPCDRPVQHLVMASTYQDGRAVVLGHDAIPANSNIVQLDNLPLMVNAIDWLNNGNAKRVAFKPGLMTSGATSLFFSSLTNNGYTINTFGGPSPRRLLPMQTSLSWGMTGMEEPTIPWPSWRSLKVSSPMAGAS